MKLLNPTSKNILIISILFLAFGCEMKHQSAHTAIFKDNSWSCNNRIVFRNDSAISFSAYDTLTNTFLNPVLSPINLTDSTLIFHRFQERGYYNQNREFQITRMEELTDTIRYDFKYINKQPKLILYLDPFPMILSSQKQITFKETKNFESIKFLIADYSIGDRIDRSLLKTRGIYNYPNYTIEDCEFIENKDITFKIIGYNSIYSIERKRIEDYRIQEIVNVVTDKLGLKPEYRPMRQWIEGSDYEYEFYRWSGHGVQINLSRSKYVGSISYKTLVNGNDWVLSYDDSYLQAILVETFRNGKPQSSIIN
jgi:hypothetical protein